MEDDAKATSCSIKTSSVAPPSFKRQCFICLLYRTTDYKKKTSVRLICCYRKRDALASLFFVDDLLSEEVEEEESFKTRQGLPRILPSCNILHELSAL